MSGSPKLSVQIGALRLKNPVMPASGTFGYGQEFEDFLDLNQLGAIIVKGTTVEPRIGNYPGRATETASGVLFSIGLQNVGIERLREEKLSYFENIESCLIVNISGHTIEEYVLLAKVLNEEKRVNALEVNVSCPNIKNGGASFGMDPGVTGSLVQQIREITDKPLIIKLPPVGVDIRFSAETCQKYGADCISLINTPPGLAIDIHTRRSKLGRNATGGLAGPAIKPLALYLVRQVWATVDLPLIGIGGIASADDAIEFLIAGASAIQIGTWNFVDPRATVKAIEGIRSYMIAHGISRVEELIGSMAEN